MTPDSAGAHDPDARVVGFVGLGAMGDPMSRSLADAGWKVLGYDVNAAAVARHRDRGGHVVDDLADLPRATRVVVTSLPTFDAVRAVVDSLGSAARDQARSLVIVETSTLALRQKEALRDLAARYGCALLDCPVSGTSAQAERGDLVAYLAASEEEAVVLATPVVQAMTRAVHDVGEFGNGTRMKLVANLLVAIHNMAAAEALLLAQRAGLDLDQVLKSVGDGAGTSRMFEVRGPLMAAGSYDHATASVQVFQKDLLAIQEMAGDLHSPTPLLSATAVFYEMAAAQGRLQQDTACVFAVLEQCLQPQNIN
ncbi:NAD(P)-dependent oxidoreductase [Allobranchiibius sp. GilTou38]|uniref:NAD(P)-dependent oxidoreductase n=1 Tax=Allobranchiibius sp. GilTou38 TaxID=2815210 RepID=UPI001AA11210|nr:NAD(P)-dependent oxidoreductase [Allobranchiibius sp. GilTou38]MBO1766743.1 NAD(P)-dependent oxidoreductase [Allobranchiibius sp. GilTou38]